MKTFIQEYTRQNAPTVAENCIKFFLWHDKTFRETIDDEREYLYSAAIPGLDCDAFLDVVRGILTGLCDPDALRSFLNDRRKLIVSPCTRSVDEYVHKELGYSGPVENLAAYIRFAAV